ncbi:MAG: YraN family protein [Bacillota bacterium]|nr:YraN family protein [Bacillota bacterium]
MSQYVSGLEGEDRAADYLIQRGFMILQKRFRSAHGEVDLIAKKGNVLYFVEVKYRPQSPLGSGMRSITKDKKARLISAAKAYLKDKPSKFKLAYLEITRAGVFFSDDVLNEN